MGIGAMSTLESKPTEKPNGFAFFFDPSIQTPLKYVITPLFYGVTAGPIYGGITGVMMNMAGTPDMHTRVLRHTALFSTMGLAFGVAGLGSMVMRFGEERSWEEADDYTTRFTSGCAAGATLGLANKNLMSACGACVSLGFLATVAKYFDEHPYDFRPDPRVQQMIKPVYTADVPDINYNPHKNSK